MTFFGSEICEVRQKSKTYYPLYRHDDDKKIGEIQFDWHFIPMASDLGNSPKVRI